MTELLYCPKIKPEHLARKAIVYIRQLSEKQVRSNLESQRLQYEVAGRIRTLGWRHVEVIDSDLGFSAGITGSPNSVDAKSPIQPSSCVKARRLTGRVEERPQLRRYPFNRLCLE